MHLENMSNMENIFLKRKNKKLFKSLFENDFRKHFHLDKKYDVW